MSTTVAQLKTSIQSKFPDSASYTDQDFLDWVNDLESDIYTRIIKKYETKTITSVASQQNYAYPSGISIDDIDRIYFQDIEYEKIDIRTFEENYGKYCFYDKGGQLYLYPIPGTAVTNGIQLICLTKPTKKTLTSENLLLPDQFVNAYKYYIQAQILILKDEDSRAQKWLNLYNDEEIKISQWYPAPYSPPKTIHNVYN